MDGEERRVFRHCPPRTLPVHTVKLNTSITLNNVSSEGGKARSQKFFPPGAIAHSVALEELCIAHIVPSSLATTVPTELGHDLFARSHASLISNLKFIHFLRVGTSLHGYMPLHTHMCNFEVSMLVIFDLA